MILELQRTVHLQFKKDDAQETPSEGEPAERNMEQRLRMIEQSGASLKGDLKHQAEGLERLTRTLECFLDRNRNKPPGPPPVTDPLLRGMRHGGAIFDFSWVLFWK